MNIPKIVSATVLTAIIGILSVWAIAIQTIVNHNGTVLTIEVEVYGIPLSLQDISLWLAFTAIILLITSELISPYYERAHLAIEKKRLRMIAMIFGLLFMFTVLTQIVLMQ